MWLPRGEAACRGHLGGSRRPEVPLQRSAALGLRRRGFTDRNHQAVGQMVELGKRLWSPAPAAKARRTQAETARMVQGSRNTVCSGQPTGSGALHS